MSPIFKRIWIIGLRGLLAEGFTQDVPAWLRGRWPEWSDERKTLTLWVVLDAFCCSTFAAPGSSGAAGDGVANDTWFEFILWAKDNVRPEDLKWIVKALRHYHVEELWAPSESRSSVERSLLPAAQRPRKGDAEPQRQPSSCPPMPKGF